MLIVHTLEANVMVQNNINFINIMKISALETSVDGRTDCIFYMLIFLTTSKLTM